MNKTINANRVKLQDKGAKEALFNTTKIYDIAVASKGRVFDNPYLIAFILLITASFLAYVIYYYYNKSSLNIKTSSSYYGKDLSFYTPLFNNSTINIETCINQCQNDISCDGITYNSDTSFCSGTKNGLIRTDTQNLSAWVKPVYDKKENKIDDIAKAIILGNARSSEIIEKTKFANPFQIGHFTYSFTLTIFDFYKNFGVWRHIFHKGTAIDSNTPVNYQSWETLSNEIPDQTIGVWISPFTNNLRIAFSTTAIQGKPSGTYPDAFVQKCDATTGTCTITDMPSGKYVDKSVISDASIPATKVTRQLEYFDHDIKNIPINTKATFTINVIGNYVEVFINGKIVKTAMLSGVANFNKSPCYVLFDKTLNCELKNFVYYPTNLLLGDVKKLTSFS